MSIIVYDVQVDTSRSIYKGFILLFFPSAPTNGSSHDAVKLILKSISFTFSLRFRYLVALKKSWPAWKHRLPLFTLSIQLSRFFLRLDKAYIAPQPRLEFLSSSSDIQNLPLAIQYIFLETDCSCECQTFDQDYYLNYLEGKESLQAIRIATLLKLWLKSLKRSSERSFLFYKMAKNIFQLALCLLLQCIEFEAVDSLIRVTGLNGSKSGSICNCEDWIEKGKSIFHLANSNVKGKGDVTKISCGRFSLRYCEDGMMCIVINDYHTLIYDEDKREEIDLLSCSTLSFRWSGCMELLCWFYLYSDELWNKQHFHGNINVDIIRLNLDPRSVHTFLMHFDDFTNINSPFNEWYRWLTKTKSDLGLEGNESVPRKELIGRDLHREVSMLQKTLWDHSCKSKELVSFLNSTCSHVESNEAMFEHTDLDNDIRQWTHNAFDSSLFDSVYPSFQVAQLFFLQKKFDILSPRFTFSVDICHIFMSSLPQNSNSLIENMNLELDATNAVFPANSNETSTNEKNRNRRVSLMKISWQRAEVCAGFPSRVLFTSNTSLKVGPTLLSYIIFVS